MLKQYSKINKLNLNFSFFQNKNIFSDSLQQTKFPYKIVIILCSNYSDSNTALFQLAATLKSQHPSCEFIFSSTNADFAVEGYKINLSFYLLQPFNYDDLAVALDKCTKKISI